MQSDEKRQAIFFDRDGTLIELVHYLRRVEQIRLLPGAVDAMRGARAAGFRVVVATNQSAVARGLLSETELTVVHQYLANQLFEFGVLVDRFYYCPHHPTEGQGEYLKECGCRKPKPGLLQLAARELGLDLTECGLIGDMLSDIEAGCQVGCRSVLVRTGYGESEATRLDSAEYRPDYIADGVAEAVQWLIQHL